MFSNACRRAEALPKPFALTARCLPLPGFHADGDFAVVKDFEFGDFDAHALHARQLQQPVWKKFEGDIGKDLIDAALRANK